MQKKGRCTGQVLKKSAPIFYLCYYSVMTVREWIFNKVDTNEKSFLKRLLISRGIKTEEEMREFLNPLEFTPYSPNVFTDMPKAVERLAKAIDNQ